MNPASAGNRPALPCRSSAARSCGTRAIRRAWRRAARARTGRQRGLPTRDLVFVGWTNALAGRADLVLATCQFACLIEPCMDRQHQWCSFGDEQRSEEHTSELQSLMRISYAVFCLKKKNT